MFVNRIHEFSCLFLIDIFLCGSYVFNKDTFYFSSISNAVSIRTFSQVSLSRCIYECKIRLQCDAINYRSEWNLCALIQEPLVLSAGSRKAFAVGHKSDWNMVIITGCPENVAVS